MMFQRRDIRVAENIFDAVVKAGIKPGEPVKVHDERGALIDFGYVDRAYFDVGDGGLPPEIRIGITSVLHGQVMYYDSAQVSSVQ